MVVGMKFNNVSRSFPKQIYTVVFYKVSMKPPSMGLWLSDIV